MIAEHMTRLSGEIAALHSNRAELIGDLARGSNDLSTSVAAFCSQLAKGRRGMAKRAKSEGMAFLKNLKSEVNARRREVAVDLRGLAKVRRGMAKRAKSERMAFLKNLKSEVNARRSEVAMDLSEVRRSWSARSC
jgi:hypothetical protein